MSSILTFPKRWLDANRVIFVNASSLVATTAVTSLLGFAYWWLAARVFPAEAVGFASAAVSAMMLLGAVGVLGLGTLLIGELKRHSGRAGSLTMASILIAAAASAVVAVLFALAAPILSPELAPLSGDLGSIIIFAAGVVLTAVTLILDQALIGILRGGLQLGRNTLFALAKLIFLYLASLWLSGSFGLTIYAAWMLGNLFSGVALAAWMLAKGIPIWHPPQWDLMRGMGRAALGHHALNLILQAPTLTLPIVVTTLLSASANASFYAAWMIAAFTFVIPSHLATVLYAVGAKDPALLAAKMRTTLRTSFALGLPLCLGLLLFSGVFLHFFGAGYAEQATWCLRILALSIFPLTVKYHFIALVRISGQIERSAPFMLLGSALEVILPAVGIGFGALTGLAVGWLIAVSIEAVFMAAKVFQTAAPQVLETAAEAT